MIALWILLGVIAGIFIMGIMCKGTIEDLERQLAHLKSIKHENK